MTDTPSRDLNKFIIRFPDGMRDRIAEVAKASGRSMNAEIIHRLEESLKGPPRAVGVAKFDELEAALEEQIAVLKEHTLFMKRQMNLDLGDAPAPYTFRPPKKR